IKNFRWLIIMLVALATANNYLDRQTLPVAISEMRDSFIISDSQYGMINGIFLLAYGTMYALGGRLLDILGTKLGYTIITIWWGLANMGHGLVNSVMGLGVARFFLGMGEGGGFPASAKVVSEWFPAHERSFAFGIFNTGSSVGAIIAPPLIAIIIATLDWRWAFYIVGSLGFFWLIGWLYFYSLPVKSKFITSEEKKYITSSLEAEKLREETDEKSREEKLPWLSLFKYRKIWGLMTIKFLTDAGWFFFIFWLPKYLSDERGLDILGIGAYAWIPYAFAGAGSFIGGWLSSFLIKKHVSLDMSRKICLGIAAAMLPASLLIVNASLFMALFFFSMAMFGHQFWSTIVQTLAADMFPSKIIGSVAGLMGCMGTYGAMLFSLVIGFVIEQFGYSPAFIISGLLHPFSFILVFIIIKKVEFVKLRPSIN
ncbi:MAG: MFS transporter, partial [Anditalea sp.]